MGEYWLDYEYYLMPVQMLCCMESGINNTHPTSSLLSHQTLERRATVCGVTEIDKQPTSIHCLRHEASETLTAATRLYDLPFQTPFTGDLRNQRLDESFLMCWIFDEGSFAKVSVFVECRMINSGVTLSLMSARCANPTKIENFSSFQSVPGGSFLSVA